MTARVANKLHLFQKEKREGERERERERERDGKPNTGKKVAFKNKFSQNNKNFNKVITIEVFRLIKQNEHWVNTFFEIHTDTTM